MQSSRPNLNGIISISCTNQRIVWFTIVLLPVFRISVTRLREHYSKLNYIQYSNIIEEKVACLWKLLVVESPVQNGDYNKEFGIYFKMFIGADRKQPKTQTRWLIDESVVVSGNYSFKINLYECSLIMFLIWTKRVSFKCLIHKTQ